jgi:pSer/pThr/pTyr-binding forkhead associated (FHA) protein
VESLRLVITDGVDAGRDFLVSGVLSIGRDPDVGIVIGDAEASRRHAVVSLAGEGLVVSDLESTNGTYVNGERIAGEHTLRVGDRMQIGDTVFELRTVSGPG